MKKCQLVAFAQADVLIELHSKLALVLLRPEKVSDKDDEWDQACEGKRECFCRFWVNTLSIDKLNLILRCLMEKAEPNGVNLDFKQNSSFAQEWQSQYSPGNEEEHLLNVLKLPSGFFRVFVEKKNWVLLSLTWVRLWKVSYNAKTQDTRLLAMISMIVDEKLGNWGCSQ